MVQSLRIAQYTSDNDPHPHPHLQAMLTAATKSNKFPGNLFYPFNLNSLGIGYYHLMEI